MTQIVHVSNGIVDQAPVGLLADHALADSYSADFVAGCVHDVPDAVAPGWTYEGKAFAAPAAAVGATLAAVQAALCADVDVQAEAQRGRYITAGSGQAMIYLQKQSQAAAALAALAATPPMTAEDGKARFILLAAEIGITEDPLTEAPATDVFGVARQVAATVQAWLPIGAAIEQERLKAKAAIVAATTVVAAQAAHDAVAWPSA